MSLEAAVFSILSAATGVGAVAGDRIYPNALPQGVTYPAIRYQRISTARRYAIDAKQETAMSRLQIDCYATTLAEALSLADAARAALDFYTGTAGGTSIDRIYTEGERADYEDDPEPAVHRQMLEFMVHYEE